jgi:polyisoprenoid-binding protein YceI
MTLLDAERDPGPPPDSIRTALADDRERLERRFQSIVATAARGDSSDLREEWSFFESELLGHLDAEEAHIIRVFADDDPAGARALLAGHTQIRARLTELGIDLDLHCLKAERVSAFVGELRAHGRLEEELLYPWADRRLDRRVRAQFRSALEVNRSRPLPIPQSGEWRIDCQRSSLQFSLRHIVFREIRGAFTRWGGTVRVDEDDIARSSVEVWVDLASIDTGDRERDDHLRSPEFFDVERFSRARFTSAEIKMGRDRSATVRGQLDLHGVEKVIDLEVIAHRGWTDGLGVERLAIWVKGRLDRRDFGLRWNQDLDLGGVVVGDQIEIVAHVACVRGSH